MRSVVLLVCCLGLGIGVAWADPSENAPRRETAEERARWDYSGFSNGPRRVARPRGASLARAERLGLGTREAAIRLMHRGPEAAWIEAASAARARSPERLLWPVDGGRYLRGFGYVRAHRPNLRHNGVDIGAPEGTVVRAVADGIVAYSDNGIRGFGNLVLIVHPNGWVSLYGHNSRTTVQPGWRVRRGERIALLGATGIARGPHLHFELRDSGHPVDPVALFDGGPAFVRRSAERAAAQGRVAAPQPLSADDRAMPTPLQPWVELDDHSHAHESDEDANEVPERLGGIPMGDRRLMRRLTRFSTTAEIRAAAGGRLFRDLLFPVRRGTIGAYHRRRGLEIEGGSGRVRSAADGLVVFAGNHGRRRGSVMIVHRMGWVTVYSHLGEILVRPGQRIERGAQIAAQPAASEERVRFEWFTDGHATDPRAHFRGVPSPQTSSESE